MTSGSICAADPGAFPTADARPVEAAGEQLLGGRYRIEELVGQGGMARVYRATDELLDRVVAVKVFAAAAVDDADRFRRESETRVLASLSHPSLVTLYDASTAPDGSGYLVMEFVGGGTLADRIARGPLAPHHVASLAADLGEALQVVHAAGVIHRDIKPPNVLLRAAHGRPFQATLADFGIAYLADAARMTTPGMAVGTAAYFSPEQARGAEPTPASDIYALGLVLIEALTGRRAFPQTTPIEAAVARLHTPPAVPSGFGYGWRSLLTAMTATDPLARPTAAEIAERARSLTTDEARPTAAVPVPTEPAVPTAAAAAVPVPLAPVAPTALAPTPVLQSALSPTEVVPTAAMPDRRVRRRRARRALRARVATVGVGAAVVALGIWGGVAAGAPGTDATGVRQLESRTAVVREQVADESADQATTAPPSDQTSDVSPASTEQQALPEEPAVEPAAEQVPQPVVAPAAEQDQGPKGSAERGAKASDSAGAGVETQGNGNGRSGGGKPGK
jgi:tRNA A-37 threonylcarbamoyl transferase component Bud32